MAFVAALCVAAHEHGAHLIAVVVTAIMFFLTVIVRSLDGIHDHVDHDAECAAQATEAARLEREMRLARIAAMTPDQRADYEAKVRASRREYDEHSKRRDEFLVCDFPISHDPSLLKNGPRYPKA